MKHGKEGDKKAHGNTVGWPGRGSLRVRRSSRHLNEVRGKPCGHPDAASSQEEANAEALRWGCARGPVWPARCEGRTWQLVPVALGMLVTDVPLCTPALLFQLRCVLCVFSPKPVRGTYTCY